LEANSAGWRRAAGVGLIFVGDSGATEEVVAVVEEDYKDMKL
jgi:hypothetical protein